MKLLFDTQLLLWAAGQPDKLPDAARELMEAPEIEPMFSAASLWEIVIKHGLGRSDFRVEPHQFRRGLLDNGYRELAVDGRHALALMDLPPLHKDPFDRILLAQAIAEGIPLVTADAILAAYPGPVQRV